MRWLPRAIPTATLPNKRKPLIQSTGVQWSKTEEKNWKPFSVPVEAKKKKNKNWSPNYQKQRIEKPRKLSKAPEQETVLRKMSVEDYLKPGLQLPPSLQGVAPVDEEETEKYNSNTNDEALARRNEYLAKRTSLVNFFYDIATQGSPVTKTSYNRSFPLKISNETVHCREEFDLRTLSSQDDNTQQWIVLIIKSSEGFITKKEMCSMLRLKSTEKGIVANDKIDICNEKISTTQIFSINKKELSQATSHTLHSVLSDYGIDVCGQFNSEKPHKPTGVYETTIRIEGIQMNENSLAEHLRNKKKTDSVVNFFGTDETKFHIKGIEAMLFDNELSFPEKHQNEDERTTSELVGGDGSPREIIGVIIADLLWRHSDKHLKSICVQKKWIEDKDKILKSKMHPLSKAVLYSLIQSKFDAHSALVWLRVNGVVNQLGNGCTAAIWNYFARWRTMSEENASIIQGDITDVNTQQLLIPTIAVDESESPQPLHHVDVMILILNKFDIKRRYPFTSLPSYFSSSFYNRNLYISLSSLDWFISHQPVRLKSFHLPTSFSNRFTPVLSESSEGITLVVSLTLSSSSQLTTVIGQILPSGKEFF